MRERIGLRLRPSESVVVRAAADIYAAYVQSNQVDETNRDKRIVESVEVAIEIAKMTEASIRSDEELV
ncbi:MAG: hypothetical protein KC931_04095 [Candidatus Omnitrophica bacterium]|nr:hypothetical protein [Candidatus Omnitrophota bacterium]MCA9416160.1 hypothetical protein [Candidatus Omnitrophota bacterium]MCA9423578.1 hypothetical protein [Candidatus Omnitrophota bacterium]MCA9429908.1 hypothetical protein [Candidatus Omnitrophota bacterium]MCA9434966.1 hypothetical protein [Candidatus Omnitrophota bacterium]